MNRFYICLLLSLFALSLQAQDKPELLRHQLALIARNTGESVRLRWAPTTYYAWRECNKSGFTVMRYTFMRDGKLLPADEASRGVALNSAPVRPLEGAAAWSPLMDKDDFAGVAAQALYGDKFETTVDKQNKEELSLVSQMQETETRLGFALYAADHSWQTALAMGLAFEDKSARKNETYLYRVFPAFQPYMPVDTGVISLDMRELYQLPKPLELVCRFGDHISFLSWDGSIYSNFYVSYYVERSTDGLNWKRLNEQPFTTMPKELDPEKQKTELFIDSLPENNRVYFYRILGNSSFGETGPPSDPIQGMGVEALPAYYPEINSASPTEQKGFLLNWDFLPLNESKITGFKVMRADNDKGPYTAVSGPKLLEPSVRSFTDEKPLPLNFYKIIAYDKYKREMPSFSVMAELQDATPPAAPVNVRGRILKDGTLVLSWDENKERDLRGYRVFMANNPQHDFVQETHDLRRQAYYLDTVTLATLSEKLYFRVMAEDIQHNQSALSDIAVVSRPDTIPPSQPVFDDYTAGPEGVQLRWANSSSSDLTEQRLQRRRTDTPDGKAWETIYVQKIRTGELYHSYFDSTGEPGIAYFYRVQAVDDAELSSFSNPLQSTRIDDLVRAQVTGLEAVADRSKRLVLLSWQYPRKTGIKDFVVYRAAAGQPPVSYAVAPPKVMEERGKKKKSYVFAFADENLKMNTAYQYEVRVRFEDGAISPVSAPVTIQY
jgi:hypothetical protein